MSEKYLTYTGLRTYDGKIKNWVLSRLEGLEAAGTILGYFYDNKFYEDRQHTTELEAKENFLYVDQGNANKLYVYNGSSYELVSDSGSADISLNTATVECGGITKGTDLSNKSLQQILGMMLSPYVAPSNAYIIVQRSKSGLMEYGESCNVTGIDVYWTNGSKPVSSITLSGSVAGNYDVTSGASSKSITFSPISLTVGSLSFTATINVTGESSIVTSGSASNDYVYPIYYGASELDSNHITAQGVQNLTKLIAPSVPQTLSFTTSDSYPLIASSRTLVRVTDELGITDYTASFTERSSLLSLSSDSPSWGPQNYHVYSGSKATLNGFKYIFTFA